MSELLWGIREMSMSKITIKETAVWQTNWVCSRPSYVEKCDEGISTELLGPD